VQKCHLPNRLDSERIFLRRHEERDAEQLFQLIHQNQSRLQEFLPWMELIEKLEDEINSIKSDRRKWARSELFNYGIFCKNNGLLIGSCGVHTLAWEENRCELGYWIREASLGQGYISEAIQSLEKILFEIGFKRIEIRCSSANERTQKVARQNQYVLDHVLPKERIVRGKHQDELVFVKSR